MKTNIYYQPLRHLLLLLSVSLFLISCEEDRPDLRDHLIGNYDYTIQVFIDEDGDLLYIGDQPGHYDIDGRMSVTKNNQYNDVIDFWDREELMFQGENIRDAGNAIVFNVPDQEFWIGPVSVLVRGYNYWDVSSRSYHGAFLLNDRSVEIAFSVMVMDVINNQVMVLTAFKD